MFVSSLLPQDVGLSTATLAVGIRYGSPSARRGVSLFFFQHSVAGVLPPLLPRFSLKLFHPIDGNAPQQSVAEILLRREETLHAPLSGGFPDFKVVSSLLALFGDDMPLEGGQASLR